MNKLEHVWSNLRSSLWFLPSIIVAGNVVLAITLIETDASMNNQLLAGWPRLFGAGAEGARGMLSTIASSMMSVVGVTFSMTLVALSMASSQYTSRILRNFMRSRLTQAMLGLFAGIFTYCLIVLRTIRSNDDGAFVPSLAVFFGFLLAVGGVGALIFFIHHVASSIQASSIISSVAKETIRAIDWLFPEPLGHEKHEGEPGRRSLPLAKMNWHPVLANKSGYIQTVDDNMLTRLAVDGNAIVRMEHGIGEFIVEDTALVSIASEKAPDKELISALQATFSIMSHRTVEQDVAFGIRQLVDVALKALSPGINDTTTAVTCVDYLTTILARLAARHIPSSNHHEEGELRLIAKGPDFKSLLAGSFDEIRSSARGNVAILSRMLDAVQTLASLTDDPNRRQALREQVRWIAEMVGRTIEFTHDRVKIETQLTRVNEALETNVGHRTGNDSVQ